MNTLHLILADASGTPDWESVREVFRHDGPGQTYAAVRWVLLIAAIALLFILARQVFITSRRLKLKSRPMQIFNRLAGEMGVSLADQWLLMRIAKHEQLPTPITLMLSSATLRHHTDHYMKTLAGRRRDKVMAQVAGISAALFG